MNSFKEYGLPLVPILLFISFPVVARLTRHRPFVLSRSLSINAMCACGFAGGFVRAGWDKALVAFLFIFSITSLFSVARWCEHRRYQLTLSSNETSPKVPS